MKTSRIKLKATRQFDCGRWKLRLERVPFSADKQTTVSTIPIISVSSLSVVYWALRFLKKCEAISDLAQAAPKVVWRKQRPKHKKSEIKP
jgi:hypothetical protein